MTFFQAGNPRCYPFPDRLAWCPYRATKRLPPPGARVIEQPDLVVKAMLQFAEHGTLGNDLDARARRQLQELIQEIADVPDAADEAGNKDKELGPLIVTLRQIKRNGYLSEERQAMLRTVLNWMRDNESGNAQAPD